MDEEKKHQLQGVVDEIDIILSIKDDISIDEIKNFLSKFYLLSEYEIREKISEATKNDKYIEGFHKDLKKENVSFSEKENKVEILNVKEINDEDRNLDDNIAEVKVNSQFTDLIEKEVNCEYEKEIDNESKNINYKENKVIINDNESNKDEDYLFNKNKLINKIIDEKNISEVSFIKAEVKYGQLLLEWGWKENMNKVIVCYRMDKFPVGPKDSSAYQIEVSRENNANTGSYLINRVDEGNYYFCIYTMLDYEGKVIFSKGQRRLVSNKEPSEIFYEIKSKKTILGKVKSVELILSTNEKETSLPQLVLISKFANMPIQKSDGESIFNIDYQVISKENPINFNLPTENIGKNVYLKLFFLDDSNSKLYRIISPAKEKLHFK